MWQQDWWPRWRRGRGGAPCVSAFTLIELLVVIAIIGLLSSVVFASLNSARAKAREAARLEVVRQLQRAVELFYADRGRYPGKPFVYYTTMGGAWYVRGDANAVGDPAAALAQFRTELEPYFPTLPTIPSQSSVVYEGKDNQCHVVKGSARLQYVTNGRDYKISVWLEQESSCDLVAHDGGGSTCCPIFGRGTPQESRGRSWEVYEVYTSGARNWLPTW